MAGILSPFSHHRNFLSMKILHFGTDSFSFSTSNESLSSALKSEIRFITEPYSGFFTLKQPIISTCL